MGIKSGKVKYDYITRVPTRKLFKQFNSEGTEDLDEWKKVFLECGDLTEYDAAVKLVGSWEEWQQMKRWWPDFANKIVPAWLEELEIQTRSKALKRICKDSISTSKTSITSARFIVEGGYKPKKGTVGAPIKREQDRERRIQEEIVRETTDDIERVLGAFKH